MLSFRLKPVLHRINSLSSLTRFYYNEKLKPNYDAIVIGGGHNGLIAAAYLAKEGRKVCVLERRHIVGGAAVTEEIVPGFKFSRASYVLGLLRPHIYNDLQLKKHGLEVLTRNPSSYTPLHRSYWNSSKAKSLTLGPDEAKNFQEISKFSLKDAEMYPKYELMLSKMIESLSPLLDKPSPRLDGLFKKGLLNKIRNLPQFIPLVTAANKMGIDFSKFLQLMTAPTSKILDLWFESEPLKATLATDSVIGALISPDSPGSGYVLLHHVMAEVNGHKGMWGNPVGGMGAVTQAIAKSAIEQGAEIHVDQPVKEIILDGRVATGVRTESGKEIYATQILSNATPKITFLDLLPEKSLPETFRKEIQGIDYKSPVCKINAALKELPNFSADPNLKANTAMPHHQCTIHLNCERSEFIQEAYHDVIAGNLPTKPLIELTIPSSCDSTIAPEGCHVGLFFTQYVPDQFPDGRVWDQQMKKQYADKIFETVESYAPGFKKSVIDYEVLPPPDLEEIFGLTGGNIFHGSMSLDQLYHSRPALSNSGPSTPIKELFLCGSGAHPGGGVMGAPGYIAAMTVLNKKGFQ